MKMKQEHFNYLRRQMLDYAYAPFLQDYLAQGFTEKRWRWDWCYKVPGLSKWICDNLYSYLNDDNIDVALKKISNPIYWDIQDRMK